VRLGAASFARLKCALWQSNPPFTLLIDTREGEQVLPDKRLAQTASAAEIGTTKFTCRRRWGSRKRGLDLRGKI